MNAYLIRNPEGRIAAILMVEKEDGTAITSTSNEHFDRELQIILDVLSALEPTP